MSQKSKRRADRFKLNKWTVGSTAMLACLGLFGCKARNAGSRTLGNPDLPGEDPQGTLADPETPSPASPMEALMYSYQATDDLNKLKPEVLLSQWTKNIENNPPTHNRGFRVTTQPTLDTLSFLQYQQGRADLPWLFAFAVDPACLDEENVVRKPWTIGYDLTWDREKASKFNSFCAFDEKTIKNDEWQRLRTLFGAIDPCGKLIGDYYQAKKIKLALDMTFSTGHNWIIRSPSCILKLVTDPPAVLTMFSDRRFWTTPPAADNPVAQDAVSELSNTNAFQEPGYVAFIVLLRALRETPEWNPEILDAIRRVGAESNLTLQNVRVSELVTATLDKAIECQRSKTPDKVTAQIKKLMDMLKSSRTNSGENRDARMDPVNFVKYGLARVKCN